MSGSNAEARGWGALMLLMTPRRNNLDYTTGVTTGSLVH